MNEIRTICIFGSSSERLEPSYLQLAEELGRAMAQSGFGMAFGGGRAGLMGATARGVAACNGSITGVIPERLHQPGIAFPACTKLIVTATMHERKQTMEALSDAFITLPGGFGTLEELLEVITLKQLGYHDKPIVLLNHRDFFASMLEQFELFFATGFSHIAFRELYCVAQTAQEALQYIRDYQPIAFPDKVEREEEHAI